MPNLPRLIGCGASKERQYCFLSVDEIFFNYNEPFFRNVRFNIDRSCHISKSKSSMLPYLDVSTDARCTKLPRLNSCGVSRERQYCFLSAGEIIFNFNAPFYGNMSLTEVLSFWGCVGMVVQESILISMFPRTPNAQSAAAEWVRGIKWKAVLFSICWRNICQF